MHNAYRLIALSLLHLAFACTNTYSQWVQTGGMQAGTVFVLFRANGVILAGTKGGGVYRSSNGGINWEESNKGLLCDSTYCFCSTATRIFAGTANGVYTSTDAGRSWNLCGLKGYRVRSLLVYHDSVILAGYDGSGNIFRSSDVGSSWRSVSTGVNLAINEIFTMCTIDSLIFISIYGSGVYESADGGNSWTRNTALNSVSVSSLVTANGLILAGTESGIYQSKNKGQSWQRAAIVGGSNSSFVYIFHLHDSILVAQTARECLLSTDNGSEWRSFSALEDQIWTATFSEGTLLAGTANTGIFRSNDDGATWNSSSSGLNVANVKCLLKSGSKLFAGVLGAGVFCSTNEGKTWIPKNNGLLDRRINCFCSIDTLLLVGTPTGVMLTSNLGESWEQSANKSTVTSLAFSAGKIYACGNGLPKLSIDSGRSWTTINTGFGGDIFYSVLARDSVIMAGAFNNLYCSTDGGNEWFEAQLPNNHCTALAATDSLIYAAVSSYGIYQSSTDGLYWFSKNIGLNSNLITSIATSWRTVVVGSIDGGVSISDDTSSTWSQLNDQLSTRNINTLLSTPPYLLAGTCGKGVWIRNMGWSSTDVDGTNILNSNVCYVTPMPATDYLLVHRLPNSIWEYRAVATNCLGQQFRLPVLSCSPSELVLDTTSLVNGMYCLKCSTQNNQVATTFLVHR